MKFFDKTWQCLEDPAQPWKLLVKPGKPSCIVPKCTKRKTLDLFCISSNSFVIPFFSYKNMFCLNLCVYLRDMLMICHLFVIHTNFALCVCISLFQNKWTITQNITKKRFINQLINRFVSQSISHIFFLLFLHKFVSCSFYWPSLSSHTLRHWLSQIFSHHDGENLKQYMFQFGQFLHCNVKTIENQGCIEIRFDYSNDVKCQALLLRYNQYWSKKNGWHIMKLYVSWKQPSL